MMKKKDERMEKFFVEIFNALGFLGLSAFALVGLIVWNSLRGIPIIENILVSSVLLFMFVSFLFTRRVI